jgi:hypothetical protein
MQCNASSCLVGDTEGVFEHMEGQGLVVRAEHTQYLAGLGLAAVLCLLMVRIDRLRKPGRAAQGERQMRTAGWTGKVLQNATGSVSDGRSR